MKKNWIYVIVAVVVAVLVWGIMAIFNKNSSQSGTSSGGFSISTTEPTPTPSVVATESPVISPVSSTTPKINNPISDVSPSPANTQNYTVSMKNFSFEPNNITVSSGTNVVFVNNDSVPHSVSFASISSGLIQPGGSYSHVFKTKETYPVKCVIHPSMVGTITVQ